MASWTGAGLKGEASSLRKVSLGVLGAAGYTGLLVWHGGLGGSAPLKVAEKGHLASLVPNATWADSLPDALTLSETALTGWSQAVTWTTVVVVVLTFLWLGRRLGGGSDNVLPEVAEARRAPSGGVPHVRKDWLSVWIEVGSSRGFWEWHVWLAPRHGRGRRVPCSSWRL